MIGIKSGIDWSKAPEWATHCHPKNKFFYKLNAAGDMLAGGDGKGYESFNVLKGWQKLLGQGCISKEDDLQLETKPKYSSLQELPVGTFVKFSGSKSPVYVWGGNKQGLLSLDQVSSFGSFKDQVSYYKGFKYKYNSDFDIVAYSDKYDGEYTLIIKEQPTPQAIKDGWKIKHIKSPDYKCGRDVAVTILYREGLSNETEYKYAICNPKDMFDRKIGVQTALSKECTIIFGRDDLFRRILCDVFASKESVSPQFEELLNWYCNNY